MSKNLISEIVKLLGVEMEEAFKIRRPDYEICENGIYAFFEGEGLMKKNQQGEFDNNNSIEFEDLCLGDYEVVKLPWEPKYCDDYYVLDARTGIIECYSWGATTFDLAVKAMGIIYRTEAEAKTHMAEDYERLTGRKLVEKKIPWEPKRGESYYAINIADTTTPYIAWHAWNGYVRDYVSLQLGIIYKTKEEAEEHFVEDYQRLTGRKLER